MWSEQSRSPPTDAWFHEDADAGQGAARQWLTWTERFQSARGAHADLRHGEVLVNPLTDVPPVGYFSSAPIIALLQIGCALDHPDQGWAGFCPVFVLE